MRVRLIALMFSFLVVSQYAAWGAPDEKMMSEALSLRDQGEFEKATRVLQTWLDQNTTSGEAADRRSVEFEIERIRRIRQDYTLTREKLIAQLQDRLTTFTEAELDGYEREGKLDVQLIDQQKLYVNSSASNLVLRVPELRARLKDRKKDTAYARLYEQMLTARKAAELTSMSMVMPQDFQVTYTVVVSPNAAPAGKTIRCWLPFVHSFPYQADAAILKSSPELAAISPPEYPHRSVYMERTAEKDQPATFSLSFVYRSWARNNNLDPALVQEYDKSDPEYIYYTAERKPHIDFGTEDIKRIDMEVSAGDANPLLQARRIYDWIAHNTIYQYAREYSTLDNISQYTAARRAGDCGQHAMLFIALCRMNGIPARWTTGWESFNARGQNMHDWCEFYVKPWGWLPADPDMAVNVLNYANDELTTGQKAELANWLFGNMDNDRLTVNSDYGRELYPAKTDFRSETVDFQRGEVEADGKNLYFDKWDWTMRIKPIAAADAENLRKQFIPQRVKMPEVPVAVPKPAAAKTTQTVETGDVKSTAAAETKTTSTPELKTTSTAEAKTTATAYAKTTSTQEVKPAATAEVTTSGTAEAVTTGTAKAVPTSTTESKTSAPADAKSSVTAQTTGTVAVAATTVTVEEKPATAEAVTSGTEVTSGTATGA